MRYIIHLTWMIDNLMKIKHIITSGCSFAELVEFNWPFIFEKKIKERFPDTSFTHRGMTSQGNDLIQKKANLALSEALDNYDPSEIALIIMWSGTERKAFYVDNEHFISEVVEGWNNGSQAWGIQFADLKSNVDHQTYATHPANGRRTFYNKKGGWYICNYVLPHDSIFTKEFYNLSGTIIGPVTNSLENIIMLENTCKVKNVKLFHCFYRSYVYDDIIENKDHQNINYLFKQLDQENIISTTGLYEHLMPIVGDMEEHLIKYIWGKIWYRGQITEHVEKYFLDDHFHPNKLGSTKWVDDVLIPKLTERDFFK